MALSLIIKHLALSPLKRAEMVGIREFEDVVRAVKSKGLRVIIKLKKTRHVMAIENEVRALSPEGTYVSWSKAFPMPPHEVLDAYGVESIEIYCKGQLLRKVSSWRDFVKELQYLGNCY